MPDEIVEVPEQKLSINDLFQKDITFQELPESVKEYFQHFFDKLPQTISGHKSQLEVIQRMKNILTAAYVRDALFDHIVKTKEKWADKDNPEEWVRQVNPAIFTKLKQMMDLNSSEIAELHDTGDFGDDDFTIKETTVRQIMSERRVIMEKDNKVIDADFKVVEEDA